MRRPPAAAVLVAAAVAAALLAIALAGGWWGGASTATPSPGAAISAQASLSPSAVRFGDLLSARAVVVVDPARVKTSSVRFVPRFGSYRVVSDRRALQRAGGLTRVSYSFVLECLTAGCAPGRAQVALVFPEAMLLFRGRTGAPGRLAVTWPSVTLASRLDDSDRADPTARLRADTSPPAVSYSLSPGTLVDGLAAAAGLLVLTAGVLLLLAFPRKAAAQAEPEPDGARRTPLEDALLLVREAAFDGHGPKTRRLALQRLVRELLRLDRGELAQTAGRLAWSSGEPSPGSASEFAARVEREVSEER